MASRTREPVAEKLPSNADHAEPTAWSDGVRHLAHGQWYWLATVRPDGRPHVMPVLSVWVDGALYFVAGERTRKARNLAADAHCVITHEEGDAHMVLEGTATIVRDEPTLRRVADEYASKYGWHPRPEDGAFDADYGAPTAGPPPYDVYEVTPTTAFGFGMETFSPTRWRF
jgi:nitroimidazol reductase NimA-like FMN-containing flavoprotein (pyridoxamine 5'-phosphate oxidase superfamily)